MSLLMLVLPDASPDFPGASPWLRCLGCPEISIPMYWWELGGGSPAVSRSSCSQPSFLFPDNRGAGPGCQKGKRTCCNWGNRGPELGAKVPATIQSSSGWTGLNCLSVGGWQRLISSRFWFPLSRVCLRPLLGACL